MKRIFIFIAAATILLSSCHVYEKYEKTQSLPDQLYGTTENVIAADTTKNIGEVSWRSFFADPYLQTLIDSALARNTNMQQAHLQVQEMEAALKASKLAYIPSFTFAPNASYSAAGPSSSIAYDVAVSAQWQIDIFGNLTNAKRKTQALTEQARDYAQATQVELIAAMANLYYQLVLADHELQILQKTDTLWKQGVEIQRAMMAAGLSYSSAVDQMEASLYSVELQIINVKVQIEQLENSICLLLAETPHHINRSTHYLITLPNNYSIGLPIAILSNRPDVRAAERNLEAAHYATCAARSAMYPNITLGGTFGFGSNSISITPGQVLANILAQLTQPIFAQGGLRANLKISKAKQEEAKLAFAQKLLDAGVEVNEALTNCHASSQKDILLQKQVTALESAYKATNELMNNGKTNYLEVLTAQESYLSAQLNQSANNYESVRNLISLYVSLGGGTQ